MATLIQGFDARLANRSFLVFGRSDSGAQGWAPECQTSKAKIGRLASLASNPLVTVPVWELWGLCPISPNPVSPNPNSPQTRVIYLFS